MTARLLTATASGDILELRPGGSWTAANAATLEQLSDGIASQLDRSATIRLDMAGVSELDTLGAWLLEKCHDGQRRRVAAPMSRE
jgi:phospholipid/cholesterol/gamma-HCH transport system permease protein